MATTPHVRLTAVGTLGNSLNEIWSCSLHVIVRAGGAVVAPDQAVVNGIAGNGLTPWVTFISTQVAGNFDGAFFSKAVRLQYVKAAAVLASGKDDPGVNSSSTSAPVGAQGGGPTGPGATNITYEVPYTVAMCFTLLGNNFRRGPGAYGRFYAPIPNLHYSEQPGTVQHMVDGQMNETVVQAFATQGAQLITQLNSAFSAQNLNQKTGIVSNVSKSTAAVPSRWQPITSVRCDNRPDTIRRRGNAISGQGLKSASV